METQENSPINAKRETILDAATAAFRDEGYDCTSMDRIAELAGASKRTVYNHFGSKDALFQAVLARLLDASAGLEQLDWDAERPLEDQLVDFAQAKAVLAEDAASLCLVRVVFGVFIKHPELVRDVIARSTEQENSLVTWLRKADEAGRLAVPDPQLAANVFWSMAKGALFWPQLLQGPMDAGTRNALMDELVQTFLARYRPSSG
jgi:TetR/AcrR family transcriptional regulator of autoinduction and epiphytic fitness